jgi:hypothetical protein
MIIATMVYIWNGNFIASTPRLVSPNNSLYMLNLNGLSYPSSSTSWTGIRLVIRSSPISISVLQEFCIFIPCINDGPRYTLSGGNVANPGITFLYPCGFGSWTAPTSLFSVTERRDMPRIGGGKADSDKSSRLPVIGVERRGS